MNKINIRVIIIENKQLNHPICQKGQYKTCPQRTYNLARFIVELSSFVESINYVIFKFIPCLFMGHYLLLFLSKELSLLRSIICHWNTQSCLGAILTWLNPD